MTQIEEQIYILGGGPIGLALAVQLSNHGKTPIVVRTSGNDPEEKIQPVGIHAATYSRKPAPIRMVPLELIQDVRGLLVITAKSFANKSIAQQIHEKNIRGPVIVMQNGLGVEKPFLDRGFDGVYRCVIYATAQKVAADQVIFQSIRSSPIGVIDGNPTGLAGYVTLLSTEGFPFHQEPDIQEQIWTKAIINSVFNSVCPLLEVDNGVFIRDPDAANLAKEIVTECLQVAQAVGFELEGRRIMEQLLQISEGSFGQLISTLQDLQNGRQTEIDSLNLEISRIAEKQAPPIKVPLTRTLGTLIRMKSLAARNP